MKYDITLSSNRLNKATAQDYAECVLATGMYAKDDQLSVSRTVIERLLIDSLDYPHPNNKTTARLNDQWVSLPALSAEKSKDVRITLQKVMAGSGMIFSSDGARLHVIEIGETKEPFYRSSDPIKTKKERFSWLGDAEVERYYSTSKRIIEQARANNSFECEFSLDKITVHNHQIYLRVERNNTPYYYNMQHVVDAMRSYQPDIYINDSGTMILENWSTCYAILMPVNL